MCMACAQVLLVSALPEDLALATLAHEAGHVWLHLNGFDETQKVDRVALPPDPAPHPTRTLSLNPQPKPHPHPHPHPHPLT